MGAPSVSNLVSILLEKKKGVNEAKSDQRSAFSKNK